MPSRQLADAALVLVGGTLLLAPGFLTDIVGFFFILPFTRPIARTLLEAVVAKRLLGWGLRRPAARAVRWARSAPVGRRPVQRRPPDIIEGEVLEPRPP